MFQFDNPFGGITDQIGEFFTEEFWARIYRIVVGTLLILIAIIVSLRTDMRRAALFSRPPIV